MDYEAIDLMADACVLDVDLPTFLNEYHLPTDGPSKKSNVGGVRNEDGTNGTGDKKLYVLTDFSSVQDSFFQQQNWSSSSEADLNSLSNVLLCSSQQQFSTTTAAAHPLIFKQESSPNELIQPLAPSSWHENFIDVFESTSLYPINQHSEDTFLESVLHQAETDNAVEEFLSIVEESAKSNQQHQEFGLQNPQQILEEIYRECEYIETLSNGSSSPPLVFVEENVLAAAGYEFELNINNSNTHSLEQQNAFDADETTVGSPFDESEYGSASGTEDDESSRSMSVFAFSAYQQSKFKSSKQLAPTSTTAKKKSQNRKAASRYRSKKKLERHAVDSEVKQLERRNVALKSTVEDLEREVLYLKKFLNEIRSARNLKRTNNQLLSNKIEQTVPKGKKGRI